MATVFERASQIRKAHPKKDWQACVKQAGKEAKGKKVAGKKKPAVGAKPKRKRIAAAPVKTRISGVKKTGSAIKGYSIGMVHVNNIAKMEKQYALAKRDKKELLKHLINAEHDKLDILKRQLKKA